MGGARIAGARVVAAPESVSEDRPLDSSRSMRHNADAMRLLFVRHGQMEGRAHRNVDRAAIDRVFQQAHDGPLSDLGRRQAARVADHFARHRVGAVYASSLRRARETAEVTAERLGQTVEVRDDLRELRTGALPDGSRRARFVELAARSPLPEPARRAVLGATLIPLYFQSWYVGRTVGGETRAGFDARLERVFDELRRRHRPDDRVALFAHGYLILLAALDAAPGLRGRARVARRPYIPNGSITEIELDPSGRATLVRYAKTRHLRG